MRQLLMMGRDLGRKLNVARDGAERVAGAGVQKRVSRTRKKKRGKKNLSTFPPPAAETFSHNLTLVRSQGTSSSSTGTDNTSSPPSLFLRPSRTTPLSPLKTGFDHSLGRCVSLDCEFVGTGLKGSVSMVGRCAIVNHHGHAIYDTFVAPLAPVTDYRTRWSGIRKKNLYGAPDFVSVQSKVKDILKGRILVGHDVSQDLKILDIIHPLKDTRDTSRYMFNPFNKNTKGKRSKLQTQLKHMAGIDIQHGEHNPVEDAQAAMMLYQSSKDKWETSLLAIDHNFK